MHISRIQRLKRTSSSAVLFPPGAGARRGPLALSARIRSGSKLMPAAPDIAVVLLVIPNIRAACSTSATDYAPCMNAPVLCDVV